MLTTDPVDPATIEQLIAEGAQSVAAIARKLPPCRGKKRAPHTVVRWITEGRRGVRLEGFTGIGKGWFTSLPAVARFFSQLTAKRLRRPLPTPASEERARRQREREQRAFARELGGR